jgi:hypothetical protein
MPIIRGAPWIGVIICVTRRRSIGNLPKRPKNCSPVPLLRGGCLTKHEPSPRRPPCGAPCTGCPRSHDTIVARLSTCESCLIVARCLHRIGAVEGFVSHTDSAPASLCAALVAPLIRPRHDHRPTKRRSLRWSAPIVLRFHTAVAGAICPDGRGTDEAAVSCLAGPHQKLLETPK